MKYQLTIPPAAGTGTQTQLTVESSNWMGALSVALVQLGAKQIPRGKAICEVKQDGTILVRNPQDGREFRIRPVHKEARGTVVDKPGTELPRQRTPYGTMSFLEKELKQAENAALRNKESTSDFAAHAANPTDSSVRQTSAHPCMVFERSDIERRIEQHNEALRKAQERPGDGAPMMVRRNGDDNAQPVRFIKVVEVDRAPDTLTMLRVDLDALRHGTGPTHAVGPSEGQPPAGFEWFQEPFNHALTTSASLREMADRALRLALAALPCKGAIMVSRGGGDYDYSALAGIGQWSQEIGVARTIEGSPLEPVFSEGMSMAIDERPSRQFSTRLLAAPFAFIPRNALILAITNGTRTLGAIILADALSGSRFDSCALALGNYIATRVYADLEYWSRGQPQAQKQH